MSRALFVDLEPADEVVLEHIARSTGLPRATVAGRLIHAALAADLPVEHAHPDHNPDPEAA